MRYMRAVIILSITWLIKDRIGLHSVRPSTSYKCLHVFFMSRSVIQGVRITQQEIQFRLIYNNTCYQFESRKTKCVRNIWENIRKVAEAKVGL